MKFQVNLSGKTLYTFMRQAGYAPAFTKATAGKPSDEQVFQRPGGNVYPKFHIYAIQGNDMATLNLHFDQKKPSYKGSHAHAAEHDGQLVEQEAARIQAESGA